MCITFSGYCRTCLCGTYLRGKRGTACLSFPTISQVSSGRSFLSFFPLKNYWCSLSRDYIVLRLRSHTNYLLVAIIKINLVDSNASSSASLASYLREPAIRRLAGDRSGSQISLCPHSNTSRTPSQDPEPRRISHVFRRRPLIWA